ncbi:MAG TPA: TonB-dependent receptor plug domain-containing protein [Flavisolibacter sp.]|jgi:iron complex outermembrane receptor protein|nr:TonB-dependent receptor plug domain-containing protein [Flavisolibacter sp.]
MKRQPWIEFSLVLLLCHVIKRKSIPYAFFFILLAFSWSQVQSQVVFSPRDLKNLSVEELMNLEVTLVSRTPEKLAETASAIQVITNEDIRRSGASHLAEALRLAPNLQVAQLNASTWLISARGFNSIFSNKLLVMIDGRTVYTPLYGGVLWEQQNVLLEDIDRIEVVSGPGGTLWGANAVNGVINIVTKSAKASQGLYASFAAGSFLKNKASLRYGGKIGEKVWFSIFGQHFNRDNTTLPNGTHYTDAWKMTSGGFKVDWDISSRDALSVQGGYYDGKRKTAGTPSPLNGQNVMARWSRQYSTRSSLALEVYFDRYYRADAPTFSSDKMNTVNADFQHRFGIGKQHTLIWGAGYRYVKDDADFEIRSGAGILPRYKRLDQFDAFVQDEIALTNSLRLVLGTKLLHNVYTNWEWQPNARIAWQKTKSTLWGAVSRAVRTPSRFDVDYFLPLTPQPPNLPSVAGGPNFVSEKLMAYEIGYRVQPTHKSSFSLSTFYNVYRDVYSVEPLPNTLTYQIQNGSEGRSWGAELLANYQLLSRWRLRGGYTFFAKELEAKKGRNFNPAYLGNDARNQGMLQSILDLPGNLQLDVVARYIDPLAKTFATERVPSYLTFDARFAYANKGWEIAVVGQNLGQERHTEFGIIPIPRGVFAKISARF